MGPEQRENAAPLIRDKMKGVFVKVLEKARPQNRQGSKGVSAAGGYVGMAHSGLRKFFGNEGLSAEPRLDLDLPAPSTATGVDPVRLVAEALEVLSPASFRASVVGREISVTVDDEATAEVFRAALEQTAATRPTDRLIVVRVRADA